MPPLLAWHLQLLACPLPPSFLQGRGSNVGAGLRSAMCTRVSVVCHTCPAWTTHAACVYLRSDACRVYTLATCTDMACIPGTQAPHVCMSCLPWHEHGVYHT